ncbi:NUDIX domain-containing protein [Polynucleobacter sp. Adler-ghost]|nr:NUDIX domain-containing protein [Polynucleobacter sp. Adler-ghost]
MNSPLPFISISRRILDSENPFSRSNQLGHITASGLVIKGGKVILIFHPYIKEWFQPGGHIDDGESPIEAAIREVYEETGILCAPTDGQLDPVDIDLHEIPANPKKSEGAHLHIDLLFVLQVIEERESPEGIQKAWVPFDQITSPRINRALQKLQDWA